MILVVACAATVIAGAATVYAAQREPEGRILDHGDVLEYQVSDEEVDEIREYWTEERIREAEPAGPLPIVRD